MRDIEVQKLMNVADDLRKGGKYKEAIQHYINTMKLTRGDWRKDIKDELWQKKVISIACNGIGIAYSKLGKQADALDNFADAVLYAPNEELRQIAKTNLEKLQRALKNKTGIGFISRFIKKQDH